jgi:2,3-dihydroxyphenylpropionate 1,2-dioxygenase
MHTALTIACSHAGLIATRRDDAPPEQAASFFGGAEAVREEIRALDPDALIVLATDHMKAWTLAGGVPPYAIGVGPVAHGIGDAGVPARDIPVHHDIAAALLTELTVAGASLAFTEDVRIDHSFVVPLDLFDRDAEYPIVPITQNCNVPPRPTMAASYEFGIRLRAAMERIDGRVVVIATGGLSHWVGDDRRRAFMNRRPGTRLPDLVAHPVELEETGPVNAEFDRDFLDAVCAGRVREFMSDWPDDVLEARAGNGAHELRNWLTACALADDAPAEIVAYEPVPEWLTGVGIVRFIAPAQG